MFKHLAILVVAFILSFASQSAFAQVGTGEGSCQKPDTQNAEVVALNKFPQLIKNALGPNNVLIAFTQQGLAASGKTMPIARKLAGIILLISMLFSIAMAMVSNKPFGPVVVENLLIAGIVAMILNKYGLFVGVATDLAQSLNGTVGGTLSNAIFELTTKTFNIVGSVFEAIYKGYSCLSVYEQIAKLGELIVGLFFLGIAIILILLAFGEMLYVYLLGPVLIAIGIAVGPLFIALVISKFTKPFFDRWLSFMFSAAILQYLALLIISIMSGVMESAVKIGSSTSFAIHAIAIAVIAHMIAKIFTQVPGIASGLTGGKTGTMGGTAGVGAAVGAAAGAVAGIGGTIASAANSGLASGGKGANVAAKAGSVATKAATNVVTRAGPPSK